MGKGISWELAFADKLSEILSYVETLAKHSLGQCFASVSTYESISDKLSEILSYVETLAKHCPRE